MSQPARSKTTSILLLIILTFVWGSSFILMKQGLKVFSAGEVGAIRVVAASAFLFPVAITKLRGLNASDLGRLFFSGLMGIFFPAFLFATAQTKLESSVTGILNSLTPMFTLIIGVTIFKQRFKIQSLLGIVIGLIGAVVLVLARAGGAIANVNNYVVFVLFACTCYGINVNFVKLKITGLNPLTITSIALLLIGPFALLYLLGFTDFTTTVSQNDQALKALGYIVLLGIMGTSIATILFTQLIKISTPIFASSITYLIPIVAVVWGVLDGEQLLTGHFVGMAAIIVGVYLANKK